MLTVYSNGVGYPISNDDYYIRQLASGLDEVVFNVSIRDEVFKYILEEAVIRDRNQQEYVIKQIDAGNETAKVVAQVNIDDWKQTLYINYSNHSNTVGNTITGIAPAGWSVIDQSQKGISRTIPTSDTTQEYNVTAWEIVMACCDTYSVRVRVDAANKYLYIINPSLYTNVGAFATRDLNLRSLNYKGKSENFVTRLYATGADGLTFESINNGKSYVEDHTYSNKVISAYWKDERYTNKSTLLADAQAKLAEMAKPTRSYDCDILDLANTNPDVYGFENFALFNIITLIDDAQERRLDYQIVEKWDYPYYPARNKVILSTKTPNIQSMVATISSAINSPVSTFSQKIQTAIAIMTQLVTGNEGGYVVLNDSDSDGYPDEILVMDTPSIATAVKVWRWNNSGLGFSSTGYNGTYTLGLNMLGQINADMITAGHLNGAVITGGSISIDALSEEAQNSIASLHSYIASDVTSSLSNWTGNAVSNNKCAIETIGGVDCLSIDGTSYDSFSDYRLAWTPLTLFGRQKVTVRYKCMVTGSVPLSSYDWTLYYKQDNANSYWSQYVKFQNETPIGVTPVGNLEANQWYEFTYTYDMTTSPNGGVAKGTTPYLRFFVLPGVKRYIKDISVTTTLDSYASASFTFTQEGLSSTVQKNNIISTINQSAESVTISASKINLSGDLDLKGSFTSQDPIYSNVTSEIAEGQLNIYYQEDIIAKVCQLQLANNDYNWYYGSFEAYTNDGVKHSKMDALGIETDGKIVCNGITVSTPTNDISTFNGDVQFKGDVTNWTGGVQFRSDRRKKRNIKDLALQKARSFIMALRPVKYKFTKDLSNSDRYHHGFIAQEVHGAMPEDWGLYCEDKKSDFIGLRYDEIIADLVKVVQDQEKRIEALEMEIKKQRRDSR